MIIKDIQIQRDGSIPIYRQIADNIKELIILEKLDYDVPLPPIRKLAKELSVNPSTIVKSYGILEQEGLIYTSGGSGTFVVPTDSRSRHSYYSGDASGEEILLQNSHFEIKEGFINLASTSSTPELFPVEQFKQSINHIIERDGGEVFGYQESKGYLQLRKTISTYLQNYNITAKEDFIQIISGAQQGIDILSKSLVGFGDTVVVEEPTYVGAIASFKARGADIIGVSNTPKGIDLDNLEKVLKTKRPKLLYTMPNFHNPTGYCYDINTKKEVLFLAKKYNLTIIEDDFASELFFNGETLPTLKSMDKEDRVIYIKSFSKIFAPGLRLAFILYPQGFSKEIITAKHSSDISTSGLIQRAFEHYLSHNKWKHHIEHLKSVYQNRCNTLTNYIDNNLREYISYHRPMGGISLWLMLKEGYSANDICIQARNKGLIILPGSAFHSKGEDIPNIRISFSEEKCENLIKGMDVLKNILLENNTQQRSFLNPLI